MLLCFRRKLRNPLWRKAMSTMEWPEKNDKRNQRLCISIWRPSKRRFRRCARLTPQVLPLLLIRQGWNNVTCTKLWKLMIVHHLMHLVHTDECFDEVRLGRITRRRRYVRDTVKIHDYVIMCHKNCWNCYCTMTNLKNWLTKALYEHRYSKRRVYGLPRAR